MPKIKNNIDKSDFNSELASQTIKYTFAIIGDSLFQEDCFIKDVFSVPVL